MPITITVGDRVRVVLPEGTSPAIADLHDGQTGTVAEAGQTAIGRDGWIVRMDADHPADGGPWLVHYPDGWLAPA